MHSVFTQFTYKNLKLNIFALKSIKAERPQGLHKAEGENKE